MSLETQSDFTISTVRQIVIPAMEYFHVATEPMPFEELAKELDPLIEDLHRELRSAKLSEDLPNVLRYFQDPATDHEDHYIMQIGIPVSKGMLPRAKAEILSLQEFHCIGAHVWGSFHHVKDAYQALHLAKDEQGLEASGEYREWYYHIYDPDLSLSSIGIFMGLMQD